MSDRDKNWIIQVGVFYLAHPRGEWTKDPQHAYGWHYKNGASKVYDLWKNYHESILGRLGSPPGMVSKQPINCKVYLMRRHDGKEL